MATLLCGAAGLLPLARARRYSALDYLWKTALEFLVRDQVQGPVALVSLLCGDIIPPISDGPALMIHNAHLDSPIGWNAEALATKSL